MKAEDPQSYAAGLATPDLQQFKDKHNELLDIIVKLRDNNIDQHIELPQIIVVGDQSSGKSSVLEAISRVRFPSKAKLGTRFATELVLREAAKPEMEVTIKPDPNEQKHVKEKLAAFSRVKGEFADLASLIKEAAAVMDVGTSKNAFSKHVLRVRISGPDVTPLTLVDLPGIYHAGTKNQPPEYRSLVLELAAEYMKQKTSITLAVISAKHGPEMQQILEKIRKHDPRGHRTLGIVTKPDQMESGMEEEFLPLIKNIEDSPHYLKHGWHVLRNRGEGEDEDFDARDQRESDLLKSRPWTQVPASNKGITSLRRKLSKMLLTHVANQLPGVIKSIENLVAENTHDLAGLGDPRSGYRDYILYLEKIASSFEQLVWQSLGAQPKVSKFFGSAGFEEAGESDTENRNLRSEVRSLNSAFIAVLRKSGSSRIIQWKDPLEKEPWLSDTIPAELEDRAALYNAKEPEAVTQDQIEQLAHRRAMVSRGNELPGSHPSWLALTLFEDQAKPWKSIATRHIQLVREAVESSITDILDHVTGKDDQLRDRMEKYFVQPFLEKRRLVLEDKLEELLPRVHIGSYALAQDAQFHRRTNQRFQQRVTRRVDEVVRKSGLNKAVEHALQSSPSFGKDAINCADETVHEWAPERILDYMVEYYGMTLETFMTNVIMLAVENQLMMQIPEMLNTRKIVGMSEEDLEWLAGESPETKAMRTKITQDLATLQKGLDVCEKWRREHRGSTALAAVVHSWAEAKADVKGHSLIQVTALEVGEDL